MRTVTLAALVVPALLASCGGDDGPAPYTLQINSQDVVLNAVTRVEIVLQPRGDLDRTFRMVPDQDHAGGEISTRVSAAGEYVIVIERTWVEDHAAMPSSMQAFVLDVPLQASTAADDPSILDPMLTVTFIRGDERIAEGARLVTWPLPPGGEDIVTVTCIRPEFSRQCTNNDGLGGGTTDAGASDPDAGATEPDAGAADSG